jgi:hypothetical protein
MRCLVLLCCAVLAGCTAKYPEGVLACTRAADCPTGWVCRLNRLCYSSIARAGSGGSVAEVGGAGGIGTRGHALTGR